MLNTCINLLKEVRKNKPLIHHITNYVTVNDCANITLEIGASPVMAEAIEEAADIATISGALVLNMGTLNERTIDSMIIAGKSANSINIPVVFDPVGAGASKFRNDTAARLINELKLNVVRGNISEIKTLAGLSAETKGVDAAEKDIVDVNNVGEITKSLAQKLDCVVVVSGTIDTISDGNKIIYIENGHPMLTNLTGSGCMCTSLIGSFCGVAKKEEYLEASVAAMLCMGIAGKLAYEKSGQFGNGSFHIALHDAISKMDEKTLERLAKIREA